MEIGEAKAVVIDNGSAVCKAGFAGDDLPTMVFASVVGRPKYIDESNEYFASDIFVGEEAQKMRGVLEITYPIEQGIIKNWDDMEKIWNQVLYYELKVQPEDHPFLVTESSMFSEANRENITQIMFETYNIPNLYICNPAVLSLYSSGRLTGVVMECGDGISQMIPVVGGKILSNAANMATHAGRDLTNYLRTILLRNGHNFTNTSAEHEIIREIKEKLCFTVPDFYNEEVTTQGNPAPSMTYELPDGSTVSIGNERFLCPEFLFQPELHGKAIEGVHKMLFNSIKACDETYREILYSNIVLSGGTTMLSGIGERLYKELRNLAHSTDKIRITAPNDRNYSSWIGGSIIGSLSTFQNLTISRQDYFEEGPSIATKKCS